MGRPAATKDKKNNLQCIRQIAQYLNKIQLLAALNQLYYIKYI